MWFGCVLKIVTQQLCQPVYPKKPFKAMSPCCWRCRHVVGFEMFFVADHAVFGDVFLFLRSSQAVKMRMSRMYLSWYSGIFPVYKYDFDRIVWYFRRLSSCRFLLCCSDFLPADLRGKPGVVTVYWVILMRTTGMGELEEIGRGGWSERASS